MIIKENYGMSIYSVAISPQGRVKSLVPEVFSRFTTCADYHEESLVCFDGREPHWTTLEAGHMPSLSLLILQNNIIDHERREA